MPRLNRLILAASVAAMLAPVSAKAGTYYWDGPQGVTDPADGTSQGGLGVWDTTFQNWDFGGAHVAWPNSLSDEASFGGTAATVSLGTAISANQLTFTVGGYTIDNGGTPGNTLTLGGGTPTITVTNASDSATISAVVTGSSLTKAGNGTLVVGNTANTYSGATTISGGTLSVSADGSLGTAPGAATPGSLTLSGGTLATTASFTLSANRGVALGGSGGTISVASSTTLTYGGILAGTGGLTKTGAGTLSLTTATNTFAGGITLNGGTLTYDADARLGAAANGITFINGTLNFTGSAYTSTRALTVNAGSSGTLQTPGTGATSTTGKITIGSALLTGGGTFTKLGAGDMQFTAAQSFAGTFIVGGGIELSVANALGASTAIQIQNGGELAVSANQGNAITITNNGTGSAPIISPIGNSNTSLTGPIAVNSALSVALRGFNSASTGFNLTFSGPLTGSGVITISGATGLGQTLFLNGNNSAYTASFNVPAGLNLSFGAINSFGTGTVTINSTASALGGFGAGYDFGATLPTFTNNRTGAVAGVFGINTTLAATTTLNLSTLGGGGMFLGAQGAGTYSATTLTPDGATYRLGGGGGTLTLSGTNALTGATAVIAGDTHTNGTGTVVLAAANDYTGATTVNPGTTLQVANNGALGATATGTTVTAGGSLALSGNVTVNEPLSVTGTSSTAGTTNLVNGLVNVSGTNTYAGAITATTGSNNFRISSTAGTINLPGAISLSGGGTAAGLVFAGAGTINQTGVLSGAGSVFVTSTGTVNASTLNTYTFATTFQNAAGTFNVLTFNSVNGGTPLLASSSLGAPTTVANGTLQFGTTTTAGSVSYVGTGETTDRVINLAGTTAGGTIWQSGTGLLKFTSNLTATGAGTKTLTLQGSTSGTGEIAGVIVNNSAANVTNVAKSGTGTWTLSAANTYTGTTAVNQGTLVFSTVSSVGGAASNLGMPTTVANGTISLGSGTTTSVSGTLQYIGTGSITDRVINLASNTATGILDQSGTGTFQVGAVTATGAGSKVLTLTGSTAGVGVVAGIIANNSAINTTGVTKTGSGTWILSGANTYTGATTISGGVLRINGSNTAATGAVAVNGGGFLGGTGTVGSAVTVAANGGIDLRDGAVGTLTLGSTLTLSGTATTQNSLLFDLGSSTVDTIAVTGAVNAATANGALVAFNQLGGTPLANGTYTLITSSATSVPTGFALATTQSGGHTYSLTTNTTGNILQVTVGTATAGPAATVWGGTASGAWTAAGNWYTDATGGTLAGAVPGVGTNVSFSTTTPTALNPSTTLGADFEINSLTFLSTATAPVTIAGGTSNALTIDAGTANGNTAGNGISQLATVNHTISSRLGIASAQTWTVASGGTLTVSGLVFDTGTGFTLTKAGAGTLTLSGTSNTFTGNINVTGGVMAFAGSNGANGDPLSLGAGTKTITITNNAIVRPTSTANMTSTNAKKFVVGAGGATFDVATGVTFQFDDANQFGGTGDLTVTGAGTGVVYLTSQANNFSGNVFVNSGTLRLGSNSMLGTTPGRTITVASGATLDTNNTVTAANVPFGIALNGGTLSASTATGSFAQAVTLGANSFVSAGTGFTETLSGNIGGAFSVTKSGAGLTVLSGTNTYAAAAGASTIISAGTLQATTTAALPNYGTAGQVSVLSTGMLALNVGGAGEFGLTDVTNLLASGDFANGSGIGFDTTNAGGSFTAPAITPTPTVALFNLTKLGTGTLVLPNANGFGTGSTTILNGSVNVTSGVTNPLGTGALVLGTTSGAPGGLDLGTSNQTVTTLTVPTNSSTANTIAIGSGNTLLATGAVTIGTSGTTTTKLNVTGASGTFSIGTAGTATNANVQIGGNVTDAVSNAATLDLSGVGTFFANIGTGIFRVGDLTNSSGTATLSSTLILAPTSTIIATTITSDSPDSLQTEVIKLGSGVNSFQANTITIGAAGNRASGTLSFNTGTGTLKVRGLTGGSTRSVLNVAYGNSTTAATPTATVDLTGHSADLLLSSLNVGGRTGSNGGAMTGTFSFDTGTLDTTAIIAGNRASTGTGNTGTSTGTVNLGGGNVTVGTTGISIAPNTSTLAGSPTVGVVNISGGTVSVGATGGGNITLGSSANANGPSTATLNVTGGSLTVNGNIAKGTITGTVTSTVTLNGSDALLDLTGHSIGTAAAPINTLTFTAGTLQNVAAINGTGGVIKAAPGTLTLAGTNGYSGGTTVTAGTVLVSGSITGSVNVSNNAIFGGAGTVFTGANGTVNVASDGVIAPGPTTPGATIDTLTIDATGKTIGPALSFASGASFTFELNTGVMTNDSIAIAHASSGSVAFLNNNINFSDLSGGALSNMDYVLFSADAADAYSGLSTDGNGFITSGLSFTGLNVYPEAALRVVDNNIVLTAVPEPASAAMLLAGMGSLLGLMRCRRRSA